MKITKAASVELSGAPSAEQLEKINRLTKKAVTAEEVYVFSVRLCDDQVDRDNERFSESCIRELAALFIGKTGVMDHVWSAEKQVARIFDTEVLAEQAIDFVKTLPESRVLDLCAGSGCVGLAVAKFCPGSHVVLGELMEGALRVCRRNIRRSGLTSQVMPWQVDALDGPPPRFGEFDCIVSNPPYIPDGDIAGLDVSVRDYEPLTALKGGADGLDFYRAISEKWRAALHPGSRLFFEVGIGQADDVLRIMRAQGFGDIEIVPDTAGIPRVVYGTLYDSVFDNGES